MTSSAINCENLIEPDVVWSCVLYPQPTTSRALYPVVVDSSWGCLTLDNLQSTFTLSNYLIGKFTIIFPMFNPYEWYQLLLKLGTTLFCPSKTTLTNVYLRKVFTVWKLKKNQRKCCMNLTITFKNICLTIGSRFLMQLLFFLIWLWAFILTKVAYFWSVRILKIYLISWLSRIYFLKNSRIVELSVYNLLFLKKISYCHMKNVTT